MKRAQYFIVSRELSMHTINEIEPETIKGLLTSKRILKDSVNSQQLSIDWKI